MDLRAMTQCLLSGTLSQNFTVLTLTVALAFHVSSLLSFLLQRQGDSQCSVDSGGLNVSQWLYTTWWTSSKTGR